MNKRKALIGYSSPVGYYYDFESDRGHPGPILEAPLSLFIFYDELWFMSRDLCPYNMKDLEYVHFVDEDLLPEGLPADFTQGINELDKIGEFPWDFWEQTILSGFVADSRYDNHARSRRFGELHILPTPGTYDNFLVDHYIANTYKLELVENSVNSEWMSVFEQSLLDLYTSEKLLTPRLPSLQSREGPYHPVVDDLRSDNLIKRYRSKISEAASSQEFGDISKLVNELSNEYDRIVAELASVQFSNSRIVDGAASLSLGQIPIISNLVSAIQGLSQLLGSYKARKDHGWVGFIARTKTSSSKLSNL